MLGSEQLSAQGVEIVLGDLPDFDSVSTALKGVTGAYYMYGDNMAWEVGEWTQTFTGPANLVKEVHGNSVFWPSVTAMHGTAGSEGLKFADFNNAAGGESGVR